MVCGGVILTLDLAIDVDKERTVCRISLGIRNNERCLGDVMNQNAIKLNSSLRVFVGNQLTLLFGQWPKQLWELHAAIQRSHDAKQPFCLS